MNWEQLTKAALSAREMSYAPYSQFRVGAALLGKSGNIYTGCNIESAAFSPTNCAERTALFKAVSEGEREFVAIAISGGTDDSPADYFYPCGVCRQMLNEFVYDDFVVVVARSVADYKVHSFGELMPFGFGARDIKYNRLYDSQNTHHVDIID